MHLRDVTSSTSVERRGFLTTLGLTGLSTALWSVFGTARGAHAEEVDQGSTGDLSSRPATAILASKSSSVSLSTGPFQTFAIPTGARLGVCLIFAGAAQGRGRKPLISGVERAEIDLPGVGPLEVDRGVAQGVYRMLGGFHIERPVEVFGLSAAAGGQGGDAAGSAQLTWEASLRGGSVTPDRLRQYLQGFHACVVGLVAEDSRFTGQMSYVEVNDVS